MKVYTLQHVRRGDEDEDESFKFCGIYSSLDAAQTAIQRYLDKPGFKNYPDGFDIVDYELDKDGWVEGFGVDTAEST